MKITGRTPVDGNTKDVEIIVPLKYLGNFWRTLETAIINCEINLTLTMLANLMVRKLCYYQFNRLRNNRNSRYKTECRSSKHVQLHVQLSLRQCKIIATIETRVQKNINWSNYQSSINADARPVFRSPD